ncbi:MAG: class I SAM-dependent methyltransferase [Candidatus Micrarchaeota archaeon]
MKIITKDYVKLAIHQVGKMMEHVPKGERVLDIGAGPGLFNHLFRKKFEWIVALDKFGPPKRKYKSRKDRERNKWKEKYGQNDADEKIIFDIDKLKPMPFRPRSFDFIFASNIIEHLKHPFHFEREIFRLLGPGGMALIITPKRKCLIAYYDKLFKGGYNGWDDDHKILYQPQELGRELKKRGFKIVKYMPTGILFYYVAAIPLLEPLNMGISLLVQKPVDGRK